ncbi:MAG: hypothetical protein D6732_06925 [Methanobacteriota archaeon]|nr:MAG: hypothetical protein D6732_06925 [Euryarchaeota archaeon]
MRYFFLAFISIIAFFVVPGIMDAYPDWAPYGSINDRSLVGFSDTASQLEHSGYSISRFLDPIETFANRDPHSVLVFFPDSIPLSQSDVIVSRYRANLPTIIVGDYFPPIDLETYIGCKYLDYESPFHSIAHVAVTGFNGKDYVSIVPKPIFNYGDNPDQITPLLVPKNPSYEICSSSYYELPPPIQEPVAVKKGSVVVIADEFMLRNNFTRQYPQNLDLLPDILKSYFPTVNSLIVYERGLNYMPINKEGLRLTIEKNSIGSALVIFIGIILLGVLIGALSTGLIDQNVPLSGFQARLVRRLERLHTKRIPAVPLSTEESILLKEHFMYRESGADYFKRVAIETLRFISEEGLEELVPSNLIISLQQLAAYRYNPSVAWEILGKVKYILDVIEKNPLFVQGIMSQKDEGREISIFDLPVFSQRSSITYDVSPDYFGIPYVKDDAKE